MKDAHTIAYIQTRAQKNNSMQHMTRKMRTKLPNNCRKSINTPHTPQICAQTEQLWAHWSVLCPPATVDPFFSLCSSSTPSHYQPLRIISIFHWTSSLHYQLHEDMKFLAITSHRCEESWMVTALICASSGLPGLSNFHLPAEAVALSDAVKTPTGFLLGESVMRLWWWGLFVASSNCWRLSSHLLLVMCEHACLRMRGERWRGESLDACLPAGDSVCGCIACVCTIKKGWRKRKTQRNEETRAPLQWKYLTHGWLFIVANDSVVLSGSCRSITHWTREKTEIESVSSCIFVHLFLCFVWYTCCEFKENTRNPPVQ